jgi:hypothetical protein
MRKKLIKIVIRFSAIFAAQAASFLRVGAEDGHYYDIWNRAGRTRMRLADISPAYQSNVCSHCEG